MPGQVQCWILNLLKLIMITPNEESSIILAFQNHFNIMLRCNKIPHHCGSYLDVEDHEVLPMYLQVHSESHTHLVLRNAAILCTNFMSKGKYK